MIFNLTDNLSAKFDNITKKIKNVTDTVHTIGFEVDDSVISKTEAIGNKVVAATGGIEKASKGAADATKKHADAQKSAQDAVSKATDAGTKHTSVLEAIKGKYEGLTGSVGKLKSTLAGVSALLAGSAMAGYSWKASEESSQYKESILDRLSKRLGTKKVDTKAIEEFVSKAADSGYTSPTDRLQLTNLMVNRGARNTKQAINAADALEKVFFKDSVMLEKDYGITSSEQLGEYATAKNIRGDMAKNLDYLFGSGFSKLSQSSRIKKLQKLGVDIDIDSVMEERPLEVIQNRFKSISRSVGSELKGPMTFLSNQFAHLLGIVDENPILPKILAIGAALSAVGGVVLSIGAALPILKAGFGNVASSMNLLGKAGNLGKLSSMLLSPWGILIAIAAIILIVAYRTGVLQKAWDKFTSSKIGGDVLSGISSLILFFGDLIDKTEMWYEASGKNQMLEGFYLLVDVLGNAWDYIDRIYSTMTKSGASPLLAGITALSALPVALAMGTFKTFSGGKGAEDILEAVEDKFSSLLRWVSTTFPYFGKIHELTDKGISWFESLYDLLNGIWNWLMDAIPGAKKESARQSISEDIEKINKNSPQYDVSYEYEKNKFRVYDTSINSPSPIEISSRADLSKYIGGTRAKTLYGEAKTYTESPSFAQGVADAVSKGRGNLGNIVGSAVSGSLKDITVNLASDALTGSIDALNKTISSWNPLNWASNGGPFSGASTDEHYETTYSQPGKRDQTYRYYPGKNKVYLLEADKFGGWNEAEEVSWNTLDTSVQDDFNKQAAASSSDSASSKSSVTADVGATFQTTGRFTGDVHATEEIVPQAISKQGAGPIGRALAALYSAGSKPSSSGSSSVVQPVVHIHNHNSFDFSNSRFSSEFDAETIWKRIDTRIEKVSIAAVKKEIGQRRT